MIEGKTLSFRIHIVRLEYPNSKSCPLFTGVEGSIYQAVVQMMLVCRLFMLETITGYALCCVSRQNLFFFLGE